MRRSFFLFVFAFLIATVLLVSTLFLFFFENERMRLLDQRLETVASTLFASGLSMKLIENLDSTDDLINDLLGEEHVDQIINVYSLEGELLAHNITADEFPLKFSKDEQWQTYEVKDRAVRVLNIQSGRLFLQVGMVLGPSLVNKWSLGNFRFAAFLVTVVLLLIAIAYLSSGLLFSPLRHLTRELETMSSQLDRKLGQPLSQFVIGPELVKFSREGQKTKDEFQLLCDEIRRFLLKLQNYTRSYHAQTAILTHELKTPLTVLKNYLDSLKTSSDLGKAHELGSKASAEIDQLARTINDYLQWSVLTSNPEKPDVIHAVKLMDMTRKVVSDLNAIYSGRIKIVGQTDCVVFAFPDHVQQVLRNLLTNALKYSSTEKSVECVLDVQSLTVKDAGPGLPQEVLDHLGSPFNRGPRAPAQSSGLGLAWVHSLCEKYGWKLEIHSEMRTGTSIRIDFQS